MMAKYKKKNLQKNQHKTHLTRIEMNLQNPYNLQKIIKKQANENNSVVVVQTKI